MSSITFTRRINVLDAPQTGDLPDPGHAKLIAPADWFQAVRPAPIAEGPFRYSLFGSYGAGVFNPYWSEHGAFIAAGTGGHGHQPMLGAVGFDFATRQPFYVPPRDIAERDSSTQGDFGLGETTGDPYYEIIAAQPARVPSPGHTYALMSVVPPALGGGQKGSMIHVTRAAVTRTGLDHAEAAHIFDLTTGEWRRATDDTSPRSARVEATTIFDAATNRYYWVPPSIHDTRSLVYLDGNDWTFKLTSPNYGWPKAGNGPYGRATLYEHAGRRLILHFWGDMLQALDLENIAGGWKQIAYTGTLAKQNGTQNAYAHHRANNVLYARQRSSAGQQLHTLTPPAGDPFTGTWVASTITLGGDAIPEYTRSGITYGVSTEHYRSLFYIPSLQMLGWVTCNGVALLNPAKDSTGGDQNGDSGDPGETGGNEDPTGVFNSLVLVKTDIYAATQEPGGSVKFILHGSGGGQLSYGDQWDVTADIGHEPNRPWHFATSTPYGTKNITVHPLDRHQRGAGYMESYWLGWTLTKGGVLYPYTEEWMDALIEWFDRYFPNASKTNRIVEGGSMGATGLTTLIQHRPRMFAAGFAGMPRLWNPLSPNTMRIFNWERGQTENYTAESAPMLAGSAISAAEYLDVVAYAANPANPMPFYGWSTGRNDDTTPFVDHLRMLAAMRDAGRGFVFAWNNATHSGGNIVGSAIRTSYTDDMFEIGRGYPVLRESSLDDDPEVDLEGGINLGFKWRNVIESETNWSCELSNVRGDVTVKVLPYSEVFSVAVQPKTVFIPAGQWVFIEFNAS